MRASTTRRIWTCSVFLLCLFLAFTPGNANALSYAKGAFKIDLSSFGSSFEDGGLTFTPDLKRSESSSKAEVQIDPDGPKNTITVDEEKVEAADDTQAQAYNNPVAGASIENLMYNEMSGSVYAYGELGIKNKAKAEAKQLMYFTVAGTGSLELNIDYYLTDIDVEAADGSVKGESEMKLELGTWWLEDKDGNEEIKSDSIGDIKEKIDWKDLSDSSYHGMLSFLYTYDAGDFLDKDGNPVGEDGEFGVYVKITAKNKAEAQISPVPEPATMLLFGSGLICLAGLRRKFKKQ